MAIGPDGNLYVSEFAPNGSVRRYNPATGDLIDIFAEGDGFSGVFGPQFGPDGNLYVGRFEAGEIARYDRATGDFIDVFVPNGEGGVDFLNGFTFGPDNNLYVGSDADIQQFDGTTGKYIGVFASTPNSPADANLNRPLFGPDGNLYVRNIAANSIERYDGTTGEFMGTFAAGGSLSDPLGFTFGPDGNLYVASTGNDRILRYDGTSGAFIDTFVAQGSGGLDYPSSIIFLTSVPGDFDGDGILTTADINDLTGQSASRLNPTAYDLNSDTLVNDVDVTVWVRDLFRSWIGDADLNGEFNSSDLVEVLASGTYEGDILSTWSTGDFNGDGRTNSGDLVVALADGGYEQGSRAAVDAVPEPASFVMLMVGLIGTATYRRRIWPRSPAVYNDSH
jgi:streptogramin lyase